MNAKWSDNDITEFSYIDVKYCIDMLKNNKTAGIDGITAEHVKYGGDLLWRFLNNLFNACIKHGYVPKAFFMDVICPIQKKVNVCASCSDYRLITLNTIFAKLFEMSLFERFKENYDLHELQFGFVKNSGCEKALFVVRSVCEYFLSQGSSIYLALDISKAYDSINHYSLFAKLMKFKFPRSVIELLIYCYSNLKSEVKWEAVLSSSFCIKSGVRQGGPWSPWLFNLVMNDLICKLEKSNLGCWVSSLFAGSVLYADDIMLMNASVWKLQLMLNICNEFANDNGLTFNAKIQCVLCLVKD